MHNAAFRHLGMDSEYGLFEVKPGELADFLSGFKEKLSGANITIPHKESVIANIDKVVAPADLIGAVNTVALEDGLLVGYNTDVTGFVAALVDGLGFTADGRKAVILGAGGASRAVSFGLKSLGIGSITLSDIDDRKALSLAELLMKEGCDARAVAYEGEAVGELVYNSDLVVNATPCGMKDGDPELVESAFLHEGLSVFDLIYNPAETKLVREAKKRGCRAANGLGMLLYQGAEAFELWTGEKAPVDVMKKALEEALDRL
jgi:shikimate dehydrogenase